MCVGVKVNNVSVNFTTSVTPRKPHFFYRDLTAYLSIAHRILIHGGLVRLLPLHPSIGRLTNLPNVSIYSEDDCYELHISVIAKVFYCYIFSIERLRVTGVDLQRGHLL